MHVSMAVHGVHLQPVTKPGLASEGALVLLNATGSRSGLRRMSWCIVQLPWILRLSLRSQEFTVPSMLTSAWQLNSGKANARSESRQPGARGQFCCSAGACSSCSRFS